MLPAHGSVTSIFHLANAIRHGGQPGIASWLRAARERSSFLAAAIDHQPAADFLLRAALVSSDGNISPSPRLRAVSERADRATLLAIASLLLEIEPPPWLPIAAVDGHVHYELIPTADLTSLDWLRPDLEQLLLNAAIADSTHTDTLALGIGRAAELAVFAALTQSGGSAIHVSEISDRFGYDIESRDGGEIRRWEVKGCTERTGGTFHLSRNEFEKCRIYTSEWTVIQVEFSGDSLMANPVTPAHVRRIRELPSAEILTLVPADSDQFYWESSARITPMPQAWISAGVTLPPDLRLPSFTSLGRQALEMRHEMRQTTK